MVESLPLVALQGEIASEVTVGDHHALRAGYLYGQHTCVLPEVCVLNSDGVTSS